MKRNRSKRSFVATVTTLSVVALLLVGMTLAFLTDSRSTLNILGIGSDNGGGGGTKTIQIALEEAAFGAGATYAEGAGVDRGEHEYSKVVLDDILPGDEINKDSVVRNVGRKDVYARVLLLDENGESIDFTNELYSKLELEVNEDLVEHVGADGETYYYYATGDTCDELEVGESFDVFVSKTGANGTYTIKVDESVTNSDLSVFENGVGINVVVEAIQADNFNPSAFVDGVDPWGGQTIEDITGNTIR